MYVYSITKRKLIKLAFSCLLVLAGVGIGIYAILSAIDTNAASKKLPIYNVDRGDNRISLSFDAAWANSDTDTLIALLGKENIKATFFVTGEWASKYPEDVKKLFDAGHEIQNHSDTHPHVNKLNTNKLIADTKDCANKIKAITGTLPTLYRSPYGEYNDQVITTVEGMGYRPIQWDVDSLDWKDLTPAEMTKRVLKDTKSGSILLFHNDKANTDQALPDIISQLKAKKFEFVKVSELIYNENYYIDSKGTQHLASSEQPMIDPNVFDAAPTEEIIPSATEPAAAPAAAPVTEAPAPAVTEEPAK